MNILIVDDNRDYLFLLNRAMSFGRYTVFTAQDGAEAIEHLEAQDIDLIISDIRMPRMDGIRLHSYARHSPKYSQTKFIFVSGFKEIYESVVILDRTLDFFRDKTTPADDLVDLVNKLLNRNYVDHSLEPS